MKELIGGPTAPVCVRCSLEAKLVSRTFLLDALTQPLPDLSPLLFSGVADMGRRLCIYLAHF